MKLEMLQIEVEPSYSSNAGKYKGRVKFENKSDTITLHLNETLCQRILEVVAEQLVSTSRELASNLTAQCIESTNNLLENKP